MKPWDALYRWLRQQILKLWEALYRWLHEPRQTETGRPWPLPKGFHDGWSKPVENIGSRWDNFFCFWASLLAVVVFFVGLLCFGLIARDILRALGL